MTEGANEVGLPDSSEPEAAMPLWDVEHPYYCSESNYYSHEPYLRYGSWREFFEARGDNDPDLNLVFRWDWKRDAYIEREDTAGQAAYDAKFDDNYRAYKLSVFYVLQRKGIFSCCEIDVCRADEPAVREWLTRQWTQMRLLWEPLSQAEAMASI